MANALGKRRCGGATTGDIHKITPWVGGRGYNLEHPDAWRHSTLRRRAFPRRERWQCLCCRHPTDRTPRASRFKKTRQSCCNRILSRLIRRPKGRPRTIHPIPHPSHNHPSTDLGVHRVLPTTVASSPPTRRDSSGHGFCRLGKPCLKTEKVGLSVTVSHRHCSEFRVGRLDKLSPIIRHVDPCSPPWKTYDS